jgi:hypothetical protein
MSRGKTKRGEVMEKDLLQLFEAVKKAADTAATDAKSDSSPEEDRCLHHATLTRVLRFFFSPSSV